MARSAHEILTLLHDAASVPPAAFNKYFPAEQRVHNAEFMAENCPDGHCTAHNHSTNQSLVHELDMWKQSSPAYMMQPLCRQLRLSSTCQQHMTCKMLRFGLTIGLYHTNAGNAVKTQEQLFTT